MSFVFNVEQPTNQTSSDAPKIDYDALNKYVVDKVGTQKASEPMVFTISGIYDLGLQEQEDAKMEWKGDEASEQAELEKNPNQYFQTLPNDKGVPTRYKRWKVNPVQSVALAIDCPDILLDKGQFFDEPGQEHPLRLLLNGEFYDKAKGGRIVGKPYSLKENRNDDGSWSIKNNTTLYKIAEAAGCLDEQGKFKPHYLGNLLGKQILCDVQIYMSESKGKTYYNEKVKLSGKVPAVMLKSCATLDSKYIHGVNFRGTQDESVLKQLRVSVKNTMKNATNYEGSDLQKALGGSRNAASPGGSGDPSESQGNDQNDQNNQFDDVPF